MKQIIKIPTRKQVPNPSYSQLAAKQSADHTNSEGKPDPIPYNIPKEITETTYTQIAIDGSPDVLNKITKFIVENFEVE